MSAVPADAERWVALRELTGRRGPVGPEAALTVLKQVLLALAAGHRRGLVHGSCDSGSVLADGAGECKLAGARVTPRPGAAASPQADVYAAAAVFFECLTGRPLPPSHEPQLAAGAARQVEPPLQALVAYGLATDPMRRPASAGALAVELEAAARAGYGPYWEERGRSDLGARAAALTAAGDQAPVSARSSAPPRDGRRRGLLAAATVAAVALVATGGAAAAVTLHGRHHQASLTGVQAAAVAPVFKAAANVTPPVAASACTAPKAFSYTGTVSATAAGAVRYQWIYSSGKPGPVRSVSFRAAGSVLVAGATVNRETPGGGWGEIKVISPVARTSDPASYKLLCGSGSTGGVSATASVTPAARTASCDQALPAFTATGSVKSAKAETVTYYWARSDGKDTAPATLTFTAAGTKPVQPLAVTPPAASGSGEAVLVVTSPVTTASAPATYTLTCLAPQAQPAGSPAAGAAGGQGGPTGPAGPTAAGPSASTGSPSVGPGTPAGQPTTPGGTGSSQPPAPTATQTPATSPAGGGLVHTTMVWVPGILNGMAGKRNVPAQQGLAVQGGDPAWTWTVTGLPPGLSASPANNTVAITGTPTTAGTWTVTATVRDSGNPQQTLTQSFPYTIDPEVWVVVSTYFPDPVVGTPYSLQMSLNYADLNVTWTSNDLPPGLSITPAGLISGTPTKAGPYNVSVTDTVTGQPGVPGSSSGTSVWNINVDNAPAG
jgi:hypothetical protein